MNIPSLGREAHLRTRKDEAKDFLLNYPRSTWRTSSTARQGENGRLGRDPPATYAHSPLGWGAKFPRVCAPPPTAKSLTWTSALFHSSRCPVFDASFADGIDDGDFFFFSVCLRSDACVCTHLMGGCVSMVTRQIAAYCGHPWAMEHYTGHASWILKYLPTRGLPVQDTSCR